MYKGFIGTPNRESQVYRRSITGIQGSQRLHVVLSLNKKGESRYYGSDYMAGPSIIFPDFKEQQFQPATAHMGLERVAMS